MGDFNIFTIIRSHILAFREHTHSLGKVEFGKIRKTPVFSLYATAIIAGTMTWRADLHLDNAGTLIGAVALLASGLLAVFVQLCATRATYTQQINAPEKALVDNSAIHVLTGVLYSIITAVLLVIIENVDGDIKRILTAITVAFFIALVLLFIIIIPKLWSLYTTQFGVSSKLGGTADDD